MIRITDKTNPATYRFPRNVARVTDYHTLTLHSTVTLEDYELSLTDDGGYNDYYVFVTDFASVKDGEYEYAIDGNDKGLMIVGTNYKTVRKAVTDNKEYNKQEKIIQYEG